MKISKSSKRHQGPTSNSVVYLDVESNEVINIRLGICTAYQKKWNKF